MLPPPARWTRREYLGMLVSLGVLFGPWLLFGAVVVGILFAVGVLP